jgi:hypothetical protein
MIDSGVEPPAIDASPFIDAVVPLPTVDAAPGTPDAEPPPPTPDAAPPGTPCTSNATCAAAQSLGMISGDSGSQKVNGSGYQSAWFRVRATEDDDGIFGLTLLVTATLTSPPGADFDVFMYVNTGSDSVECSATIGDHSSSGSTDSVTAEWGEGALANGAADDRDVSIEVRPVSGVCSPGATWTLQVAGNQ